MRTESQRIKFRIKPGVHTNTQVWILEKRSWKWWGKWNYVFRHVDLKVVRIMKDHLLKDIEYYDSENNIPEKPIRTNAKYMNQRLKMKKSEIPESMRDFDKYDNPD